MSNGLRESCSSALVAAAPGPLETREAVLQYVGGRDERAGEGGETREVRREDGPGDERGRAAARVVGALTGIALGLAAIPGGRTLSEHGGGWRL